MSRRVLLVDDEQVVLGTLEAYLIARGYDVHCARDKEQVAVLIDRYQYDVVVADLGLSDRDLDGFQVIEHISKHPSKPRVLVFSGHSGDEIEHIAFSKGAELFLKKPLKAAEVEQAICGVLAGTSKPGTTHAEERGLVRTILAEGGMMTHLQPIVEAHDGYFITLGYECLTRGPRGTLFESPDSLFQYFRNKKMEGVADRHAIEVALRSTVELPPSVRLAFNVHPRTLACEDDFADWFLDQLLEYRRPPESCTIEIIEAPFEFHGFAGIERAVKQLRRMSVQIALDDYGIGNSNLRMLISLRPDALKIDRFLVSGCHLQALSLAAIQCHVDLAGKLGTRLIAEGVESEEELRSLLGLGIRVFQGYLFGKSAPAGDVAELLAGHHSRGQFSYSQSWQLSPKLNRECNVWGSGS